MATWEELQTAVRTTFQLDEDGPEQFALVLPRTGGRGQRVMVRHYLAWQREMVEIRSAVGEAGTFLAEASEVSTLLGSVVRDGRFFVLVQKACLEHLELAGVLFLVTHVGRVADELEERQGTDRF